MWQRFIGFFSPPKHDDPETAARARLLHVALLATLVGSVPMALLNFQQDAVSFGWVLILLALLSLVGVEVNRRGRSQWVALGISCMMYFAVIYTIIDGAGLYDAGLLALPIVVTLASFFFGEKGVWVSVGVSCASVVGLALAGSAGLIGGSLNQPVPVVQLSVIVILMIAFGALIYVLSSVWERSLLTAKETSDRLELAINSAGMGIWEGFVSGDSPEPDLRLYGKQAAAHQISSSYAEWVERLHPDDSESAQESLRQYLNEATLDSPAWSAEYRVRRYDGAYRWRLVVGRVAEWDDQGQPLRMTGMFLDITEIREAQLALFESELRYRLLTQELHDSVTQTIYSMTLTLKAAQTLLEKDPSRLGGLLVELDELAKHALNQMRTMLSQARPEVLEERGLVAAIQDHISSLKSRFGLDVAFEAVGSEVMPAGAELALYRVAQEALNNIVKHAGSTDVQVELTLGPETASLRIEDHGCGFDPGLATLEQAGFGLTNMRERVEGLGGSFNLDAVLGRGVVVMAVVPVRLNAGERHG